jgi:flagellar export protein FliJ
MAFKFSLATVLRIRTIAEEREERMLQHIQREIINTQQTLDTLDQAVVRHTSSRIEQRFRTFDGSFVHSSYGEITKLRSDRNDTADRLEKLVQLKVIQVYTYAAARRNREMLTEMSHAKQSAYNAEAARRDQAILDDNFIARRSLLQRLTLRNR